MWWARRFNRIALVVLVVAVGRVATSVAEADDSLRAPTWLIAAMPSEASNILGTVLGTNETEPTWIRLADAAAPRHLVMVGVSDSDPAQRAGSLSRLETLLSSVAEPEHPIWHLEERTDLSFLPASAARPPRYRVALYEFPALRMPRVERRLRNRLHHALATRSEHPYIVLQGDVGNQQTRIVLLEPDDSPRDRRLESWAMRKDILPGSLESSASPSVLAQTPGKLAHMLTGKLLLDPLEPLPAPTAEPSMEEAPAEEIAGALSASAPAEPIPPVPVAPLPTSAATARAGSTRAETTRAGAVPAEPASPLPPPTLDLEAVRRRVTSAVEDWARAWSSQRAADYFAAYARAFQPAGASLDRWRAERRARIQAPKVIDVRVADLDIEVVEADRVRVIFEQNYQSDRYRDRVRKQLDFVRENGAFKIEREQVLQVLARP